MEKSGEEKEKQYSETTKSSSSSSQRNMWDCGSTLYDSYELNTFKRQLDSAIANSPFRSLSMPRLPERRCLSLQPQQPAVPSSRMLNKSFNFKVSRTFHKLFRFVFKSSSKFRVSSSRSNSFQSVAEKYPKDSFYVVYDKSEPVLSTIPELPDFEIGALSPEISAFVRKSASERFTATPIGISCA